MRRAKAPCSMGRVPMPRFGEANDLSSSGKGKASNARVAVIGVGNVLMGDDGVGVRVIEQLRAEPSLQGVDVYDAGTAFQDVLPHVAECDQVIVVDAVQAGGDAGEIHCFDVRPEMLIAGEDSLSVHDMNLVSALRLQQVAGEPVPPIRVIGVEPKQIIPSLELSDEVRARLPEIVSAVIREAEKARRDGTSAPTEQEIKSGGEE